MGWYSIAGVNGSGPVQFAVTHLFTWAEKGTVRVKCLAGQGSNTDRSIWKSPLVVTDKGFLCLAHKLVINCFARMSTIVCGIEGPLYLFRDAWMAIFAVREAWMRISFFRDSWIYIFPSSGNCFRFFRDPWNMHLLSRDLWTNDFCGNNFSLFWRILVNYTKLDAKPANSMRLH